MAAIPVSRIEVFDVLAPAGRAKANPLEVQTPFQQGELVGLEIIIPAGHNGYTGIQIALAHSQAIPHIAGAWIVGNAEKVEWDLVDYPNTGAWSAFVYNTDVYDHTFHLRYLVADFGTVGGQLAQIPAAVPALT